MLIIIASVVTDQQYDLVNDVRVKRFIHMLCILNRKDFVNLLLIITGEKKLYEWIKKLGKTASNVLRYYFVKTFKY